MIRFFSNHTTKSFDFDSEIIPIINIDPKDKT